MWLIWEMWDKTFEGYEAALRIHVIPKLGRLPLSKLEPSHLERLYVELLDGGLSEATVATYHTRIHTMLKKAVRTGAIMRNVCELVDLPRRRKQELPVFTPQQAKAFLAAARGHRLEALFVLAITTAARQGELLGLTWDRAHLDSAEIDVREALQRIEGEFHLVEPKTPHSIRRIALTDLAVDALRRHRVRQAEEALRLGPAWANRFNLVFTTTIGTPLDKTNVLRRQLRPLLKSAGLPTNLRFHSLRHIGASLLLGEGVPITVVSEMLGHASPATTLRVYAHAIPGAQRTAAQAIQKLLAS